MAHVYFDEDGSIDIGSGNQNRITLANNDSGHIGIFNDTAQRLTLTFTLGSDVTLADTSALNESAHDEGNVVRQRARDAVFATPGTLTVSPGVYFLAWTTASGDASNRTVSIAATGGVSTNHGTIARLAEQTARIFFWDNVGS